MSKIYQQDEAQIARSLGAHEGEDDPGRVSICWRYSEWLREECQRLGLPAIPSRPWESVLERAIEAVSGAGQIVPR